MFFLETRLRANTLKDFKISKKRFEAALASKCVLMRGKFYLIFHYYSK